MSSAEIFELAFFFCARASFKCRSWRFGLVGLVGLLLCVMDGLSVWFACGWVGSLFRFECFVSSVSFRMCRIECAESSISFRMFRFECFVSNVSFRMCRIECAGSNVSFSNVSFRVRL